MPTVKKCVRCQAEFPCGAASESERCWCAELPRIMPVTDEGCLCENCLKREINDRMLRACRSFSIRKASPKDAERIAPLFDAYRKFYRQSSDLAGAKRFLGRRLAKKESILFFASSGPLILGFTQLYPAFSSVSMRRLWILNDLFVVAEARERGVAEALMKRAEKLAAQTRAEGLILDTARDNLPAQRLYEKLGWKRDRDFHHYGLDV